MSATDVLSLAQLNLFDHFGFCYDITKNLLRVGAWSSLIIITVGIPVRATTLTQIECYEQQRS